MIFFLNLGGCIAFINTLGITKTTITINTMKADIANSLLKILINQMMDDTMVAAYISTILLSMMQLSIYILSYLINLYPKLLL